MASFPQRKSPRLQGYDYTQPGAYFVTICTHGRVNIFGTITNDEMQLNHYGNIVLEEWHKTSERRPYLELDGFVVMPNHVHAIVMIEGNERTQHAASLHRIVPDKLSPPPIESGSLSAVVRAFKSAVTKRINEVRKSSTPVWQERFHDHIIRNEAELKTIREYVVFNPAKWQADRFYAE